MDEIAGIHARPMVSLERCVQLGVASGKVVHLSFPETPDENATGDHDLLDRVEAYLSGEREDDFEDVDVGLTVPTDQRSVLERLRGVPYGESVGVEELARMTPGLDHEDEDDRRIVPQALSANPIPLLIPDHRVDGVGGATPDDVRRRLRELEGLSP